MTQESTYSSSINVEMAKNTLPALPLNLWNYKLRLGIIISLILLDNVVLPPTLYFALRYGAHMNETNIFAITTGVFGICNMTEYFLRFKLLIQRNDNYRPLNTLAWGLYPLKSFPRRLITWLDTFHLQFSTGYSLIAFFLIYGTSSPHPLIRLIALCLPTMLLIFSFLLLFSSTLALFHFRSPIHISSLPPGHLIRPGIYHLVEDVVAVDGRQGKKWRSAWNARYEASIPMQCLVKHLSWFWGLGGIAVSTICYGSIFGFPGDEGVQIAYALGWTVPWLWAILAAIVTYVLARRTLRLEREMGYVVAGQVPTDLETVQTHNRNLPSTISAQERPNCGHNTPTGSRHHGHDQRSLPIHQAHIVDHSEAERSRNDLHRSRERWNTSGSPLSEKREKKDQTITRVQPVATSGSA